MANPKRYLKFPKTAVMTPRLRALKPRPELPVRETKLLEEEADRILAASGWVDTGKYGARDLNGLTLRSLDDDLLTPELEETSLWADDRGVAELLDEVTLIAGLNKRELAVVRSIVEGSVWGPNTGGYARVALELGTTPRAIKERWLRARKKLIENWASEDEDAYVVHFHASGNEGTGFTVVVGQARLWGPQLAPEDRSRTVHVSTIADSDWVFAPSLDPEGWPLL